MSPELEQHYNDVCELMHKVHPHFHGHNSFVVMMTLSDLIAQWLLSHPYEKQPQVLMGLIETTKDRIDQLFDEQEKETRH